VALNLFLNPYIDPNTGTAYNKLGINNPADLKQAEAELSQIRLRQLQTTPLAGEFDLSHLRAFHRHILQDVYDWAGKTRESFDSAKFHSIEGRTRSFTPSARITEEATALFSSLKSEDHLRGLSREGFAERGAALLNAINKIHAFPDGNGRAQRAFLEHLGREVGHPLNFSVVSGERMVRASVAGMDGDLAPMARMFAEVTDPARVEQLSKAIGFLDNHKNVLDWNNAYLATSTPGQTYSGQLVSRGGDDFMLREARGMIIIGNVADLPDGVQPAQRLTFTASDAKIPASGFPTTYPN
jgi:cell filamentation protein